MIDKWIITKGYMWGKVLGPSPYGDGLMVMMAPKQDQRVLEVGEIERGRVAYVSRDSVAATFSHASDASGARYNALRMRKPEKTVEQVLSYLKEISE